MTPALRRWIVILWLACCESASAVPYPTADQLREAIAESAALLKSERMAVEIQDAG
ncbi:MAG: hypothetical protein ABI790_13085 [Betaproteobacteria bacterium]